MGSWWTWMWIGVGLVGEAGIRAGRVDAISQLEFRGNFSRKGWGSQNMFDGGMVGHVSSGLVAGVRDKLLDQSDIHQKM